MILGFRDLIGDMGGVNVPGEIGTEVSRALAQCCTATCCGPGRIPTARSRSRPTVGSRASPPRARPPIRLTGDTGPGWGRAAAISTIPRRWSESPQLSSPHQGGVGQIPGFLEVVATSIHIRDAQENGLLWRDNTTGDTKAALQNFVTPDVNDKFTGFAKSNGLGDLDAFTGLAPVQIGNRLWYDTNRDGIQDADEPPVTNTVVELVDCNGTVVDTTRTDSEGEYVFDIEAGACYRVRVPLDQPSLDGWEPTTPFVGDHRLIDSNGREVSGRSVAVVVPHGAGAE